MASPSNTLIKHLKSNFFFLTGFRHKDMFNVKGNGNSNYPNYMVYSVL